MEVGLGATADHDEPTPSNKSITTSSQSVKRSIAHRGILHKSGAAGSAKKLGDWVAIAPGGHGGALGVVGSANRFGQQEQEGGEAAWLMLFFDLLYVAIAGKIAGCIAHNLERGALFSEGDSPSFAVIFLIFLTFLCIWLDTQIYFANVAITSVRDLLLQMVEMGCSLQMLVSLGDSAEHPLGVVDWPILMFWLFGSRLCSLLQWVLVQRAQPLESRERAQCWWMVRVKCFSALLILGIAGLYYGLSISGECFWCLPNEQLLPALLLFLCTLIDLCARAFPGRPGALPSRIGDVDSHTRALMIHRCGEIMMVMLGELAGGSDYAVTGRRVLAE